MEDDSTVRALVRVVLEQAGYDVRAVPDCDSARREILTRTPGILVIDVGLPDGNGLDIVRGLVPQALGGPLAVVLSGLRQERNVLDAFDAGAHDFMTKPFSPKELVARIRTKAAA